VQDKEFIQSHRERLYKRVGPQPMKITKISALLAISVLVPQVAQAAPIQSVFASRAEGKNGKPLATITLWPGHSTNLNLIPTGEVIKKAWLDDPSLVAIDFDGCLPREGQGTTAEDRCSATAIRLRQTGATAPGSMSPENGSPVLILVAEGSQGKKLYQFRVEMGKGAPQYDTLTVYPDAQGTASIEVGPRKATVEDISRGLSLAEAQKLISRRDAVWGKVQNFLAQVRSGESVDNALQRSGSNIAIITKLAELSFSEPQASRAPKQDATRSAPLAPPPVAPAPPAQPPEPSADRGNVLPSIDALDEKRPPPAPASLAPLPQAGSPAEVLARFAIPLKEGGAVSANHLLGVQERIWWWKRGIYRKRLGTFIAALVSSRETDPDRSLERAIEQSGLSLNDVRYFAKAGQRPVNPITPSSSSKKSEQSSASPLPKEAQSPSSPTVSPTAKAPLGNGSIRAILSQYQLSTQEGGYITADKLLDLQQSPWFLKRDIYRQKLGDFIATLFASQEKDPQLSLEIAAHKSGLSLNDVQFLLKTAQTAPAAKAGKTEKAGIPPARTHWSDYRPGRAETVSSNASTRSGKLPASGTVDTLFQLRIPLARGGSVGAEQLLMVQERIWNWEGGTVRKKLGHFIATLTASAPQGNDRALASALRESGLSLNEVQALLNFSSRARKI
jgi:hypothetical protein